MVLTKQVIDKIRKSTSSIRYLPLHQRQIAISAYAHALHVVFIVNLIWALLAILGVFVMKDEQMPEVEPKPAAEEEEA
jgi:hypothetical protein